MRCGIINLLPNLTLSQNIERSGRFLSTRGYAICVVLCGVLCFGYSLDRYPSFYVDDVVFAFPALQAARGGPFAFPGGDPRIPYVNQVWAYHGPVLPNLELCLFRLFGFHLFATRLPNFLGGWLAVLLLVLFLNRRGYRYAGFLFAVFWCGDRAVEELLYGRMDGIALLAVVLLFVRVDRYCERRSATDAWLGGFLAGFGVLVHPLCAIFGLVAFLVVAFRGRVRGAGRFCLGAAINIPLLLVLWHFHPVESWAQFHFVATALNKITGVNRLSKAVAVLRWSRYWFLSLLVVAVCCASASLWMLLRKVKASFDPGWNRDFALASLFCGAALTLLIRSSFYPYYIIYFSVWPMLCGVILIERFWPRFRVIAIVWLLIWCSSAAWNLLRLREPLKFYSKLSHQFLVRELSQDVPIDATVMTSSELYAIPIEANYVHRTLLTFDPTEQDACARCFLLIPQTMFDKADYIQRSNLQQRNILYAGPAFPGAGVLQYPVVILSPKRLEQPSTKTNGRD